MYRNVLQGSSCVLDVEQLLVLLNNDNPLVRIACINILNAMLSHGLPQIKQHFLKINGNYEWNVLFSFSFIPLILNS